MACKMSIRSVGQKMNFFLRNVDSNKCVCRQVKINYMYKMISEVEIAFVILATTVIRFSY
jgi:hypothetical protein